jgi:hypothetical protein
MILLTSCHAGIYSNVFPCQVILGSGSIVTTSAGQNFGHSLVLKDGTNKFGVVTGITCKTYQLGTIWAGSIICDASIVT